MISPPTDNLYKFIAIFGIFMVISSITFWWNASNDFDSFVESNLEYVNEIMEGSDEYERFAKKTNELINIYNSVGGNIKLLSEEQRDEVDKLIAESEELKLEAGTIFESNPITRMTINIRLDKYIFAKRLSLFGLVAGALISIFGFYLWHVRLQRYIDQLHRNSAA